MRLLTEPRYALCSLRQTGGRFTAMAVVTLGLGLCATVLVAAGARSVPDDWRALLMSTRDAYVLGVRPLFQALGVAVLLVLLVSCANVAGLLLIRAIRRQRELARRHALGARWSAIVRMLLAEAVVVAAAAAILAIGFMAFALDALGPALQPQLGRPAPGGVLAFVVEARTLVAAGVIGIGAAALCTLAPLVTTLRPRSLPGIQDASRTSDGRGSQRPRAVLVALEIAASLALLTASALMLRSIGTLVQTDPGIEAERVRTGSAAQRANHDGDAPGRLAVPDGCFDLLGIPRTPGRALTAADRAGSAPVGPTRIQRSSGAGEQRRAAEIGFDGRVASDLCRWIRADRSVASAFRRKDPCPSG